MHRAALAVGLVCGVAAPAHADLFRLFAEAHGGGMYGQGTAGDQKDAAFFAKSPHGAYGLAVGAEAFIFDLWIEHHQFTNGSRVATWTKIGVGTGQQVMPPLDNAQISDKGFLIQGVLGFGTHLSKNFDLGVSLPVSWGYFFKQGAANDLSNHYQGVQGEALAVLRIQFGLF